MQTMWSGEKKTNHKFTESCMYFGTRFHYCWLINIVKRKKKKNHTAACFISSGTYQTPILSLKEFWSSSVWRLGSQRIKRFYPMRWGTCTYRVTAQPYVCRSGKKKSIRIWEICIITSAYFRKIHVLNADLMDLQLLNSSEWYKNL